MIRINVMRPFLNRLRDRGWRNIHLRGFTDGDHQILRRGNVNIVAVENIYADPSVDVGPQMDDLFNRLIETLQRAEAKEIFLPGGGDVPIPGFFRDFCRERGVRIHILSVESFRDFESYN